MKFMFYVEEIHLLLWYKEHYNKEQVHFQCAHCCVCMNLLLDFLLNFRGSMIHFVLDAMSITLSSG